MLELRHKVFELAERFVQIVEVVVALGLIVGVVGEMAFGAKHLWNTITIWSGQSFQTFIDQSMLYIIGLEIAMMLIKHKPNIVLDILIIAIARKMIVATSGGLDFFLGALAIFVLYIVRHSDFGKFSWPWGGPQGTEASVEEAPIRHP